MHFKTLSFVLFLALGEISSVVGFTGPISQVSAVEVTQYRHSGEAGDVDPLCGCVQRGRCAESLRSFTELVIRNRASELVCGLSYDLCCYENDPWPGVHDAFAHLAPCVPEEVCIRHYGTVPTDVRDFGAIGPCPGLGAVRCLDGFQPVAPPAPAPPQPEPVHLVVPIVETPTYEVTPPNWVYEPPVTVTTPPEVYEPPVPVTEPTTTTTTTLAPIGYEYPEPPVGGYQDVGAVPAPLATPIQNPYYFGGVPPRPFYPGYGAFGGLGTGFGFRKHIGFSKGFGIIG